MRKDSDGVKNGEKEKKITAEIVATNVVASRPPERRPTATPTARAKKSVDEQIFNSSQSTSLTFIICLFEMGHPSDLNGDINRRDHFRPGPRQ